MTEQEEIEQLEVKQGTVILVHYYVDPQVQEAADYVGGSFYLNKAAAGLDRRTMALYGVSFMREGGKLLSPDKMVLMSDAQADCLITHMVTKEGAEQYGRKYPDFAVVCYINSTVEIKSWSGVCTTSANAIQIIRNLPNRDILFMPDKNLGRYVASQVPEKHVMPVNGCCPVRGQTSLREVSALKETHPNARVLAHPECNIQIFELADYIGSATRTLKSTADSTSRGFITCTENGMHHELERQSPDKYFYFPDIEPTYRNMKETTLGKTIHVLRTGQNQISVPRAYAPSAGRALEQMLSLARQSPGNRSQAVDFRRSISWGGTRR